jgi:hypothetical protein
MNKPLIVVRPRTRLAPPFGDPAKPNWLIRAVHKDGGLMMCSTQYHGDTISEVRKTFERHNPEYKAKEFIQ